MKISNLPGMFKIQGMNTQSLLGSMDRWAGRSVGRAAVRGRMLGSIAATQGMKAAGGVMWSGMKSPMMKGAMWGSALGAGGAVVSDASNNNLGFGTVGRAFGGALRGGLIGGAIGGGVGASRMMMGRNTMIRSAYRSPLAIPARRRAR